MNHLSYNVFILISVIFVVNSDPQPRVLHVVDVVNGSFVSYNDNLKAIFSQVKSDTEVGIISIAGEYRKGKSFLLNFFLQYLQYRTQHGSPALTPESEMVNVIRHQNHTWLRDIQKGSGFHFKSGIRRDTTGISMWSQPFLIKKKNGKELAIIVMDSQGLYDSATEANDNVRLFTMVSLLSSSLMLNTAQNINFNQLVQLKYFMDYATTGSSSSQQSKPFQRLTFLIRDYSLGGLGWAGGQDQLDQFMKPNDQQSEDVRALAQNLTKGFTSIDSFAMPFPGREVTKKDFDGSLSKIDPLFLTHVEAFVANITESTEARKPLVVSMTSGDMINYVDRVVDVFNKQLPPDELMKMNERQVVTKIFTLIAETVRQYEDELKKHFMTKPTSYFMGRSRNQIEQEVIQKHVTLRNLHSACFEQTPSARFRMYSGANGEPITALQVMQQQMDERKDQLLPVIKTLAADKKAAGERAEREERERAALRRQEAAQAAERERQRQERERLDREAREWRRYRNCRRCFLVWCWQDC